MADIIPFRAVRYNPAAIDGDLTVVTAPPYDVISPPEQAELYERNPHNVIRLILGREADRYGSAAATYEAWKAEGVLAADPEPAIYVYKQTFRDPVTGAPVPERIGLVCLLKLEEYASGKVLPHENTLSAAKTDRLELLRATNAQFESIYCLYGDPDGAVKEWLGAHGSGESVAHVDDAIGSSHDVARVTDANAIASLAGLLKDRPFFIADGHHRYETSLRHRRETRERLADVSDETPIPEDYILITLTALEDEGLLVLPTHRLIKNVAQDRIDGLMPALAEHFEVTETTGDGMVGAIADTAASGGKAFGVALPGGRFHLATLRPEAQARLSEIVPGDEAAVTKSLDVTILQRLILHRVLGIGPEELAGGGYVAYTQKPEEALARVAAGEFQAAFLLGRPTVAEMRDVSLVGDKMPQKSTFFFPKLLSGLLLRDLANENPAEVTGE
jgi:uncharacterized protein (DUF1015 family)